MLFFSSVLFGSSDIQLKSRTLYNPDYLVWSIDYIVGVGLAQFA